MLASCHITSEIVFGPFGSAAFFSSLERPVYPTMQRLLEQLVEVLGFARRFFVSFWLKRDALGLV